MLTAVHSVASHSRFSCLKKPTNAAWVLQEKEEIVWTRKHVVNQWSENKKRTFFSFVVEMLCYDGKSCLQFFSWIEVWEILKFATNGVEKRKLLKHALLKLVNYNFSF